MRRHISLLAISLLGCSSHSLGWAQFPKSASETKSSATAATGPSQSNASGGGSGSRSLDDIRRQLKERDEDGGMMSGSADGGMMGGMGAGMDARMEYGGESYGGYGGPRMGMEGGGYGSFGGEGGYSAAEDAGEIGGMSGYDVLHGMTRNLRLDLEDLDDADPLKSYASAQPSLAQERPAVNNADKLKRILLAFHEFHKRFHHFPRCSLRVALDQPPHSWRVAILPLIGESELFRTYHFDQPWDSPANLAVADGMPDLYRSQAAEPNSTPFMLTVGDGTFDSAIPPPRLGDITDGSSNTVGAHSVGASGAVDETSRHLDSAGSPNKPRRK